MVRRQKPKKRHDSKIIDIWRRGSSFLTLLLAECGRGGEVQQEDSDRRRHLTNFGEEGKGVEEKERRKKRSLYQYEKLEKNKDF